MATRQFGGPVGHPGGVHHGLGDAPVDLDGNRRFRLERPHLRDGFGGVADQSVGGDEFGRDHGCTGLPAQDAEGRVRHVFHGRQDHWTHA